MLSVSAPQSGVFRHVVRNEPLHQRITVVREAPAGRAVRSGGRAAGRPSPGDVALKTEQQRIGRRSETARSSAGTGSTGRPSATSGIPCMAAVTRRAWRGSSTARPPPARRVPATTPTIESGRTGHLARHVVVKAVRVRVFICSFGRGSPVETATFSSEHPPARRTAQECRKRISSVFHDSRFFQPSRNYRSSLFTRSRM